MTNIIGEFAGTLVLITFGCGIMANALLVRSRGHNASWFTITLGWFIGIILGVFTAKTLGAPNADINPAVSLAKTIIFQTYSWQELGFTMAAQFAGAFVGAIVVWIAYFPHWHATRNPDRKRAVFATNGSLDHITANFISEVLCTMILAFGIGQIFTTPALGITYGPYCLGLLLWGIGLSLGGATGFSFNPARDFAPRLAHAVLPIAGKESSNWRYAWVPVLGPLAGAALGALLWKIVAVYMLTPQIV